MTKYFTHRAIFFSVGKNMNALLVTIYDVFFIIFLLPENSNDIDSLGASNGSVHRFYFIKQYIFFCTFGYKAAIQCSNNCSSGETNNGRSKEKELRSSR